jgi:hypothetical protein
MIGEVEDAFVQDTEYSNKTNSFGLFSYSGVRSAFSGNEGFSKLTEEGLKYRLVFRMGYGQGPYLWTFIPLQMMHILLGTLEL